jgi:branched-chain amino acid transport system ATP-binding protein
MLSIHKLNAGYGAVKALWDVTLHVDEGEIVAVLGANGAGKTTLVSAVVGLIEPYSHDQVLRPPHRGREPIESVSWASPTDPKGEGYSET